MDLQFCCRSSVQLLRARLVRMPHGPTYFPAKGVCIYCNDTTSRLTDEHIVPYALGGQHVLRQASCLRCADTTKKFEQRVARGLWGDARASFGAPTRRKKERPKIIEMRDPDIPSRTLSVPAGEYPGGFVFYRMPKAGLLQGLPENLNLSSAWTMSMVDDDSRRKAFLDKHPGKLTLKFRHVPDDFARMLAKIGYCHVLSLLDPDDFHPICLPYIRGEQLNLSFIVGGSAEQDAPEKAIGYRLDTVGFGSSQRLMILAQVRLYANMHTPTYHVVVGEAAGAEQVARVVSKFGVSEVARLSDGVSSDWTPDVLPLPYWLSKT